MKGIGVPEVVIVLGLMIVLIAGFLPTGTPDGSQETLILSKQAGPLGSEGLEYHHIKLADNLILSKGVEGAPLLTQSGPKEVAKGVITSQEHVIEFSIPQYTMEELSSATLSIQISETNGYGPLKITLNGISVWSEYAERDEIIEIDLPIEQIKSDNVIRITAGSSGWRIWSPTYYILEDIQIREQLTAGEKKTFSFDLTEDQIEKFFMGRVYIGNVKPLVQGEMAIILNEERMIFRGVPGRGSVINSFSSGIKDENTLTFQILENGYYDMTNLEVVIFTSANTTAGFSTSFTIPNEELSRMRTGASEGVIEIEVLGSAENPLRVILSGEEEVELYNQVAETGEIVLRFTGYEASSDNTLIIRSAGDYNLGLVNVKLVRK